MCMSLSKQSRGLFRRGCDRNMGPASRDPVCVANFQCRSGFQAKVWIWRANFDFFVILGSKNHWLIEEHPCLQSGCRQFLLFAGMICVQI